MPLTVPESECAHSHFKSLTCYDNIYLLRLYNLYLFHGTFTLFRPALSYGLFCAVGAGNVDDLVQLTQEETESILRLPKKQYLLDQSEKRCALVGLVDILYACLYDIR